MSKARAALSDEKVKEQSNEAIIQQKRFAEVNTGNGTERKLTKTSNGGIHAVRRVFKDPTGLSPTGLIYSDLTEVKIGDLLD